MIKVTFFCPHSALQSVNAPTQILLGATILPGQEDYYFWTGDAKKAGILTDWLASEGLPFDSKNVDGITSNFRPGGSLNSVHESLMIFVEQPFQDPCSKYYKGAQIRRMA